MKGQRVQAREAAPEPRRIFSIQRTPFKRKRLTSECQKCRVSCSFLPSRSSTKREERGGKGPRRGREGGTGRAGASPKVHQRHRKFSRQLPRKYGGSASVVFSWSAQFWRSPQRCVHVNVTLVNCYSNCDAAFAEEKAAGDPQTRHSFHQRMIGTAAFYCKLVNYPITHTHTHTHTPSWVTGSVQSPLQHARFYAH